jgi:hypothetical protein
MFLLTLVSTALQIVKHVEVMEPVLNVMMTSFYSKEGVLLLAQLEQLLI